MPIVPTTTNTQPAADPLELDSAKTWVLEKLNMLKSENNRHSVDLINNIDSRQYVENSGFISGKDPGTYTNQKRDYITTLLAQPQYTPPNKTAQDLWNQETNKFTSNEINSAINIEARTRINGRVKQVRNGLSMMVENVQDNPYPGNLFDALDNLEYDNEEVQTLTEKFSKTAYWKDTGSKMPDNPDKVLTGADYHHKGHHFNLKRVSLNAPAPTLTAMGSNDTTAGAFHWNEPRKLTIGELKRIQSLPDDFVLTGKWNQRSERIGRMVPPLLLKSIADSVYDNVIKEYKNG